MSGQEKSGIAVGRRDFIKTAGLAVVGSTLANGTLNAKETELGPKPQPDARYEKKRRKLLCLSEYPEQNFKTVESIEADPEIDLNVRLIKIDYRNPQKLMESIKGEGANAVLVFLPFMAFNYGRLSRYMGDLDVPVLLYSPNTDLIMINANFAAELREKGANVQFTTSETELIDMVKKAAAPGILQGKKALIFGRPFNSTSVPAHNLTEEYVYHHTGVTIRHKPVDELIGLLENIDKSDAKKEMKRWKKEAGGIDNVSDDVLLDECRMYVLLRSIIEKEGLSAISIDCLSFTLMGSGPKLPLPCLAVARLRDEGITASCEGDVCGMLSSMVFEKISGKPSYFANVSSVDKRKSSIVLRHCVAPLKLMGPNQPQLPYTLHDYHGLGKGVVPKVEFPVGIDVTMGLYSKDLKYFLLWPGKIRPGVDDISEPQDFSGMPMPAPKGPEPPPGKAGRPPFSGKPMEKYCSNRAEVKIKDVDRFFQNIAGIHHILVAGNYIKEITDAMSMENVHIIGPIDSKVS